MKTQTKICAGCGMNEEEWIVNNGKGVSQAGRFYCCDGCASGTGCTCKGQYQANYRYS